MFPSPKDLRSNSHDLHGLQATVYESLRGWDGTSVVATVPPGTSDTDINSVRKDLSARGWMTTIVKKGDWTYLRIEEEEPTGA